MAERDYHKHIEIHNVTAFADASLNFSPGINVFVGENGTGKTHAMKLLYSVQFTFSREVRVDMLGEILTKVFMLDQHESLIRTGESLDVGGSVNGVFGERPWGWTYGKVSPYWMSGDRFPGARTAVRPVYIPSIDMMAHTRGFVTTYDEYNIDFDLTHRDIVSLLLGPEKRMADNSLALSVEALNAAVGGTIGREGERFYLVTPDGRLPMPMVAEGTRKIATLAQLIRNGWLAPGAVLFWDEPEVNLNPVLMRPVVAAILALSRNGVQIFLATHSYDILREIEVQAQASDRFRFFAFEKSEDGVKVHSASTYLEIAPNMIEQHAADLYDRGIQKRINGLEVGSGAELD